MKAKLSFAQRLQKQSLSSEKSLKLSSSSKEKKQESVQVLPQSKYMHFKEQHNELKNILKLFQGQKMLEPVRELEIVPSTPLRGRITDRRQNIKTPSTPLSIKKEEAVKENFIDTAWPLSFKDISIGNTSVVLPRSSPCIPQTQGQKTPKAKEKLFKKGIPNIGNTCYINALIQCLFHLPHFNDYFANQKYKWENNGRNKDVVEIYRALYIDVMQKKEKIQISTLPLKKSVSKICMLFIDWQQEDAHEFMKELLNSIHEDLNRVKEKPKYKAIGKDIEGQSAEKMAATFWEYEKQRDNSYIYDTLCGQIYNNIRCINCNHESQCFENFLDLSVPIVPHSSSLQNLLSSFFQPEKLSDFYLCGNCNKSSKKSVKTLQLWRAPKFLIIHLKRSQFGKKNTDAIKIPESLTLKPYMTLSNDKSARYCQYNLCGVIMHRGMIEGGHYWCNVKESGKWYEIDDENVKDLNSQEFRQQLGQKGSSNAYILFYSSLYS